MSSTEREKINLNELTERELLILTAKQVSDLEDHVDCLKKSHLDMLKSHQESHQDMLLKVNTLETKSKVWGGVAALITTAITLLIEKFFRI